MECEVLLPEIARRGREMLEAMIRAAPKVGVQCRVTQKYMGRSHLLMSYGLGHLVRRQWTEGHVAKGGRLIGWDMGYWNRDAAMRVTIDQGHPQKWLHDRPPHRWSATGVPLRNDWDPDGPIVLIGMGPKSRAQFGFVGQSWELHALTKIRAAYPSRPLLYRPKRPEPLVGCRIADGPIEDVLRGASLVVCRHSNVAVDACIAGIPVVCEDGAAAALYGSDLAHPVNPDVLERRRLLNNLAWFQWTPSEAVQAWRFLLTVCELTSGAAVARSTAGPTATSNTTRPPPARLS